MAIVTSTRSGQRIISVNLAAQAAGILPKQSLADARAIYPALIIHQANPSAAFKSLTALRTVCERYTPWVAVDTFSNISGDYNRTGAGLWLDITGCAHLFGGEEALLKDLFSLLKRIGYQARAGLASTPGTAWALARYKTDPKAKPWFILHKKGNIHNTISDLPIAGLRVEYDTVEGLERMGLLRIGDLYEIPRAPLTKRFGDLVLRRLDQALGNLEEPLSPQQYQPSLSKRLVFSEPVCRKEDIEGALTQLIVALCDDLERSNQGIRQLVLKLHRVDHSIGKIQIGTSQPKRVPSHLINLFREKLDKIDPGFGVEVMVLSTSEINSLAVQQMGLNINSIAKQTENAIKLLDKLVNRLGSYNINHLELLEKHPPELAFREVSTTKLPLITKEQDWKERAGRRLRPLQLLIKPIPIRVIATVPDGPPFLFFWQRRQRRVMAAEGPERISPEWWTIKGNAQGKMAVTNKIRDYYRIEDEDGQRYWLYREGLYRPDTQPTWYIHGFFP